MPFHVFNLIKYVQYTERKQYFIFTLQRNTQNAWFIKNTPREFIFCFKKL